MEQRFASPIIRRVVSTARHVTSLGLAALAPMAGKPYAPSFEMLATRGTQGRYYPYTYPVTLKDMIKFHGHDCEGTIHAANNARLAFDILFPGVIDWETAVDTDAVMQLKADVKTAGGQPTPYQVDLLRYLQYSHVNDVLEHPLDMSYQTQVIEDFNWDDWIDPDKTIVKPHARGDIRLKDYPYRDSPISGPDAME